MELAREALHRREAGETYARIGEALGVSRGRAHHLVAAALKQREENARELARPPGRTAEPSRERGEELVTRIRRDFRAINAVIADHFGPGDEQRELSALNLDWVSTEFADDISKLLARGAQNVPAEEEVALAHLLSTERCFTDLLSIAEERNEVLREEVGVDHVLAVFSRDLAELAEILGVPFKPRAPSKPPPARGASPGHREQTRTSPPAWTPLDANERDRRNERVVTARLAGASAKETAEGHRLSERQVRRIMEAHRQGRYVGAPAALEATMKGWRQLRRELSNLGDATSTFDDPKEEMAHIRERLDLLRKQAALLRSAGLLSPEAWAAAQRASAKDERPGPDWVCSTNVRLREVLADHEVEPEVIEVAVDVVATEAGL